MTRNRALSIFSPIALLALWELAVRIGWLNPIFYPPPSEVLVTFWRLLVNGELLSNVGISVLRIILGFLLGGIPAVVIGLLMGISPAVRALVQPLAAAIYPIPKIALLPLVFVALGIGEASRIVTIAVSVFFLVVLNVAASVLQVDQRYFEVAQSFGARKWQQFWTVALPASMPGIMTSIKLGMGFALTLIVGVEFVGANEGIGWLIWRAYELYAIDRMLAGVIAVALIGWLATIALDELEHMLVPWQAANKTSKERSMHSHWYKWFITFRPWSYTAAVVPVLLGGAIAAYNGSFHLELLLLTLIGSVAIQAGTNLVNEYYDDKKGLDKVQTHGIGGFIRTGEIKAAHVLSVGIGCFALGAAIGLYLVSVAGPFILWLGVFSIAVGFLYTAGPFALAYIGMGEIAVFIFMGPVIVIGSYYVQARAVPLPVVLASLPVGFLVAAILHANNLRDLDFDRQFNKRTLATILGRHGAIIEYYVLIGATYLMLVVTVLLGRAPWLTLIALLTLPMAVRLLKIVSRETEPAKLQPVLRGTGQLHMRFGGLLVIGWVAAWLLSAWLPL